MRHAAPRCTAQNRTALRRTKLHRTVPHRTGPRRTAQHRTAPDRTAPVGRFDAHARFPRQISRTFIEHPGTIPGPPGPLPNPPKPLPEPPEPILCFTRATRTHYLGDNPGHLGCYTSHPAWWRAFHKFCLFSGSGSLAAKHPDSRSPSPGFEPRTRPIHPPTQNHLPSSADSLIFLVQSLVLNPINLKSEPLGSKLGQRSHGALQRSLSKV
jgi:hypothetical protein